MSEQVTAEPTAFRLWMADFLMEGFDDNDHWREVMDGIARDLLATPEMQAIKAHIRLVARTCCNATVESFIQGSDLPQSVKDWVICDD